MADDNNKKDLGQEIVQRASEGAITLYNPSEGAIWWPQGSCAWCSRWSSIVAIVKHAPSPDSLPEEKLLLYLDDNYWGGPHVDL